MPRMMISKFCCGSLVLLFVLLLPAMLSCGDNNHSDVAVAVPTNQVSRSNLDCGSNSHPSSKSSFSVEPGKISQMAADISTNAGKVIAASNGNPNRTIVVFEETHTSRVGQLEFALMLLRLHDKYKLRQVSLEGAFADQNELPTQWFRSIPNSKTS